MMTKKDFDDLQGSLIYQGNMLLSEIKELKQGVITKGFPKNWIVILTKLEAQLIWQQKQMKTTGELSDYVLSEITVLKRIVALLEGAIDYTAYEQIEDLCETLAGAATQTRYVSKKSFANAV